MKKMLCTILLAALLLTNSLILASDDNLSDSESEIIATLAQSESFSPDNNGHDPFCPLLKREVRKLSKLAETKGKISVLSPPTKEIKSVSLKVFGICGNPKSRFAVIKFEGNEFVVNVGQTVNGKFSVVEIVEDGIIIFALKQSRRHVFKLS